MDDTVIILDQVSQFNQGRWNSLSEYHGGEIQRNNFISLQHTKMRRCNIYSYKIYFLLHLNSVSSKHDRFGPLIFFFWKISSVCISRANPNNNFVLFLILHASSFSVWNDVRKTDPPIQIFIFRHTDIYIRWYQYFQYILR